MALIKKQELIKSKHCSVFFFSIINWINAVLQQHNTLLKMTFQEQIQQGIPSVLPKQKPYETDINHAPKRKEILSSEEKKLALRNALRYFEHICKKIFYIYAIYALSRKLYICTVYMHTYELFCILYFVILYICVYLQMYGLNSKCTVQCTLVHIDKFFVDRK